MTEAEMLAAEERNMRERLHVAGAQVVREKGKLANLIENRKFLRNEAHVVDIDEFRRLQNEIAQVEGTIAGAEGAGKMAARELKAIQAKKKALDERPSNVFRLHKKPC